MLPPEIQDNLGLILIVAALAYAAWKYKQGKKVAPAAQQGAVAPVYIQAPAAPTPDLLDITIDYQDRREREVKRAAAQQRLDQAALERAALEKIAVLMTPPKVGDDPK